MSRVQKITIAFAAGHSGGHIVPCLTIAQQQHALAHCIFFSTTSKLDAQILSTHSQVHRHIPLPVSTPRRWYQYPGYLLRLMGAFFTSLFSLHRAKPEKVISTGGLVAVPVCMAAWILRIPIDLYELNAVPGKAVKFLAPFATRIHVCFAQTKIHFSPAKCFIADYPIRYSSSVRPDLLRDKSKVLSELNFTKNRKTVLILGGSQGSLAINQAIAQLLTKNHELAAQLQIIHQTGSADTTDYAALYQSLDIPARVFPYCDNLAPFYAVANLVIARAGAGTIFETLFFGTPCILIPLETKATDHQLDNARAIVAEHPEQFVILRQSEDLVQQLKSRIKL